MRRTLLLASAFAAPVLSFQVVPVARGVAAVGRHTSAPRAVLDVGDDVMEACFLLPHDPFPGMPPEAVGGEMELQELEDDLESRTQLHLNSDGTVSFGVTDGPPPLRSCGLWQCGMEQFQMVLQRSFSAGRSVFPDANNPARVYTVTRVYQGSVDQQSTGVAVVEGVIGFYGRDSALGYFTLDGNVGLELGEHVEAV